MANKISLGHELKAKTVNELAEKIKTKKTLMIVSIKGLPSKQFQEIKKKVRGKADVRVAKKNILVRVLKEFGKESILSLEPYVNENCAFVFSDIDGFELAGILAQNKNPIFAKVGQIALDNIEIKEGPTDLVPGPAISEFGMLGVQIAVEDGKIAVKRSKVIVKEGQEIKENAASMMQKLNIQPFEVGLNPTAIYDVESEKIYTGIKIDSEEAINSLVEGAGKALGFAQKIIYYCKETIRYLLAKANADGEVLGKLSPVEEVKKEVPAEEINEEKVEEKNEEGIIEKIEDKAKEIGKDIKEEVEEVIEKVEESVKKVVEGIKEEKKEEVPVEEVKEEDTQLNNPEENA